MDKNNKLCILCCQSVFSNDRTQSLDKISQLCENISKNIYKVEDNAKAGEEISELDENFGLSVCLSCLSEINELLTSKEQMTLLENHVISLQKDILKGLRDLEKYLEKIKYLQTKISETVKGSNEFNLRKRLPIERMSNCFVFKLRHCITNNDQFIKRKLIGDLSIPETEEVQLKPAVKVEQEFNHSEDEDNSNPLWDAVDDESTKSEISAIKIEKVQQSPISTMTLRARRPKITSNKIENPKPSFIRSPLKQKKKKIIMKPLKPIPKKKKPTHIKTIRPCELCPFKTREEPSYEQHIREHEAESLEPKSLECSSCPFKFSTNQLFQFHQKCHQGLYKMLCDICNRQTSLLQLADHLRSHFPQDQQPTPKIIYCPNCSYCCSTREAYLLHLRRHNAKKIKGKFNCDICSKELSTPKGLLEHYHEKHAGTLEKWTCDITNCNKSFPARQYLIQHLHQHKSVGKVQCPDCPKVFKSKALMEVHYRVHSGEAPFPCNLCDQRFRWQSSLISHQRNDHGASKLKCETCQKEFCDQYSLKTHRRNVHENKGLPCEICGKTFGNIHVLKRHMVTHAEDKRFTCEQCGKGFKDENALKLHLKIHSGVKNYKCEYCGKAFVRRENLRDHLRVHTGERPFVCESCGKDFNQASALKTHKKNQHPS